MEISHFEKVHFLARCNSFARLSPALLGLLADEAVVVHLNRDDEILRQGDSIEFIYVVSYGNLSIRLGGRLIEDGVGAGDIIGDQEMVAGEVLSKATVVVSSEYAWLLRIPVKRIQAVMNEQPILLVALTQSFVQRRKRMQDKINYWNRLSGRIARDLSLLESSLDDVRRNAQASQAVPPRIELRFVVQVQDEGLQSASQHRLEQAYVVIEKNDEIRIRREGDQLSVTAKRDYGKRRKEIELRLDPHIYEALLKYADNRKISKTRYTLNCLGHEWRIDVYDEDTKCAGLSIAETDICDGEATPVFPHGIVPIADITDDFRYRNRSLAEDGLPKDGSSEV